MYRGQIIKIKQLIEGYGSATRRSTWSILKSNRLLGFFFRTAIAWH